MANSFETFYKLNYGRLVATVARKTHDISLAEDFVQEALLRASQKWGDTPMPDFALAWVQKSANNLALDHLRRSKNWQNKSAEIAFRAELSQSDSEEMEGLQDAVQNDDMARLIFACCHPALNMNARVALCLNTVCGLKTSEVASAFVVQEATMSQRLWRAKSKIRDAGIGFHIPQPQEYDARLSSVLAVIYLIFNEGWLSSTVESGMRTELADEAIRIARLLCSLAPIPGKAHALLALMLLQHSRRFSRFSEDNQLILLAEQDRSVWVSSEIEEGLYLLSQVFSSGQGNSRYALLAAIAATHSQAKEASQTDWNEIIVLYEQLMMRDASPIVALNHAVAVGERDGAAAGLFLVDQLSESASMQRYYLFHSTRGDFLQRLLRISEALRAFEQALELCSGPVERRFLSRRIESCKENVNPI